jgi:lipoyl-dependent peroxiredoxin
MEHMDRSAEAQWNGDLKAGKGRVKLGTGAFEGQYSFTSRFESGTGTNPEELLGAAHAACYSMALSSALAKAGHIPTRVTTTATVHLTKGDAGFAISGIALRTRGVVPGVTDAEFQQLATDTKTGCIVSRALSAVPMQLDAKLEIA